MKKSSRILAMLLVAVFAFSQLPMAALAVEEASGHDTMTSDMQDIGPDSAGSESDVGADAASFAMTILGESGEGSAEGGKSVGTWKDFESAIENEAIGVITIAGDFDAGDETGPIKINRTIRITSESEYTVTLNNASIEVVDGGNLTLDGALVLQGSGDQVIKVQEGGEATIGGEAEITAILTGILVNGGTVNIDGGTITANEDNSIGVRINDGTANIDGGTIEVTGNDSIGLRIDGGTVNITGGTITANSVGVQVAGEDAKVSITGGTITVNSSGTAYGVKVEKGTINIGGEAEISVISYSGVCVRIEDSKDANIGGRAKIKATYSGTGAKSAVSVYNSTLNIGGEAEITATNSVNPDQYGWAYGVDVDMYANNSTVTIKDDVKISADDSGVRVYGGTVTISGGTITATEKESSSVGVNNGTVTISGGRLTADRVGVRVIGEDAKVIIDGEVEISAAYSGVRVESGTTTISGGTITATAEDGFGILASDGDVNLRSSAELVMNGDICKGVWGEDWELILTELLKRLPAPISVSVGQKTAEFTLEPGEGATFGIDDVNTSEALEAGIDANNKVTLTLPGSAGTYELVLGVPLKNGTFKLTVPVIVKPQSGGSSSADDDDGKPSIMPFVAPQWLEQGDASTSIAAAKDKGYGYSLTRANGQYGVRAAAWAAFSGYQYWHDTMDGNAVQVRVYMKNPASITTDLLVSGYVKGAQAQATTTLFEKHFSNKVRTIHLDQTGAWGQTVELAARVDLTGMDLTKLMIYSYDKATNTYHRIEKPAYWLDKNGYLHFTTPYAGDIVISEGALARIEN